MHSETIEPWVHEHIFGQDAPKAGERRTVIVIAVTAAMMAVEIAAGMISGSMALLADGLHMASHASALTISALAYYYTRRHARDARFTFGTGKINSLAGFAGAVLLVGFAVIMAWESCGRLITPVRIDFSQAILVAAVGLAINGVCLLVLKGSEHESHPGDDGGRHGHPHHDHNLWSAYLHVLADAATSVMAIVALLAGKRFGYVWLDPLIGIAGAGLVVRWSLGLIRSSARVLLDMQAPAAITHAIRSAIENVGANRVTDLHVWAVGPGIFSAEVGLVTSEPKDPDYYQGLLPERLGVVHFTVEVHPCRDRMPSGAARPKP